MTHIIELAVKDIKIVFITVFYIFRKLEERLNMLIRGMQDFKRNQIKLLEMKIVTYEMKIHRMGLMSD